MIADVMIITCFVLGAAIFGLMLSLMFAWTEIKILRDQVDVLRDLGGGNLDLIESLDRSMHFNQKSLRSFVTSTIDNLEDKMKLQDWDFREHQVNDVLRDLIEYLELDWQQQRKSVIFKKREKS